MKKALFIISITIVTILFFVSVSLNIYFLINKLNEPEFHQKLNPDKSLGQIFIFQNLLFDMKSIVV